MSKASRDLERQFRDLRDSVDRDVFRIGAVARVKGNVLREATRPLGGLDWRRLAAGVILAGMLGGALDLMLPEPSPGPSEIAILDPLDLEVGIQE
jgi:hypothetical protein